LGGFSPRNHLVHNFQQEKWNSRFNEYALWLEGEEWINMTNQEKQDPSSFQAKILMKLMWNIIWDEDKRRKHQVMQEQQQQQQLQQQQLQDRNIQAQKKVVSWSDKELTCTYCKETVIGDVGFKTHFDHCKENEKTLQKVYEEKIKENELIPTVIEKQIDNLTHCHILIFMLWL
jgi:hypothetical protein